MAAILFHEPIFATIVESGDKLYFYEVGTTSDLTVYTNFALTNPAPQPVPADSDGRFPALYIDSTGNDPKVVLTDSDDVEKWTAARYPIEDTAALSQSVTDLETDVTTLEGRVNGAESDIDSLEATSADHETRLDDLEGGEGSGSVTVEVFTGNGTWAKPDGLVSIKVIVTGGGGGSVPYGQNTAGGAAGGTAIKWISASALGSTESVSVGTGGAGKSSNPGNAGGNSSFGAHCSATGGQGGQSALSNNASITPGTGSNGDLNFTGGHGIGSNFAAGQPLFFGGASYWGSSLYGSQPDNPGAGAAPTLGGGGIDGGDGIVVVEQYF